MNRDRIEQLATQAGFGSDEPDHTLDYAMGRRKNITQEELNRLQIFANLVAAHAIQDNLTSWAKDPDRMGGQFTQEEIHRHDEWR